MDFVRPVRPVKLALVGGRGHYDTVVRAVMEARRSVWIATANLKELLVEDGRARPGVRRGGRVRTYQSVMAVFEELAGRGVDLRVLHAGRPSRAFRAAWAGRPVLRARMLLRQCPRVHAKIVVVDGALLYLGSANWTGAGLGAKGVGRRNFELGMVTSDDLLLDEAQAFFDHVWSGAGCGPCRLRDECPHPLDGPALGPKTGDPTRAAL